MNQIPNIEETNTREVEEIKYKAKQMIDVNSIMPEVSIDEAVEYLAEQLLQTLHQQLQSIHTSLVAAVEGMETEERDEYGVKYKSAKELKQDFLTIINSIFKE